MKRLVYVINGPNLNLLGKRQPAIYGHETLADVEAACRRVATENKLELKFHQSNREYEIIDWIHEARETAAKLWKAAKKGEDPFALLATLRAAAPKATDKPKGKLFADAMAEYLAAKSAHWGGL